MQRHHIVVFCFCWGDDISVVCLQLTFLMLSFPIAGASAFMLPYPPTLLWQVPPVGTWSGMAAVPPWSIRLPTRLCL